MVFSDLINGTILFGTLFEKRLFGTTNEITAIHNTKIKFATG